MDTARAQRGTFAPAFVRDWRTTDSSKDEAEGKAFFEQRLVWLWDAKDTFVSGSIVAEDEGVATVVRKDGQRVQVPLESLSPVNPPKFDRVSDMAELTFLNEPSVVHNLETRYAAGDIYTYSGLFLVAVNPYRKLPLYGSPYVERYRNSARGASSNAIASAAGRDIALPPHIYAVCDQALQDMVAMREHQSILVTGESGAGKTESTKIIIQYMTAISQGHIAGQDAPQSPACSGMGLEDRVLQANPILEAFGNAKTARNDNSSRFGKFIRLEFDGNGVISGATIDYYLLENSRVNIQSKQERNYHIFYQVLAGISPEQRESLFLSESPDDFEYLKHSCKEIRGVDDAREFAGLQRAFSIMGITRDELNDIIAMIAIVLHLGNVKVLSERSGQARIDNYAHVERLSHLLGVSATEFVRALTKPRVKAGSEWVSNSRSREQVEHALGSLARVLYEKMFGYIVEMVNQRLKGSRPTEYYIGILDIAGFEIFESNSFEQFCINYTNEKLQQFFNHHMFVLEQEEYMREGIEWEFLDFGRDLQPTIDLIEKTNPVGILSCLDEECVMPKATDQTFSEKLHKLWSGKSPKFQSALNRKDGFTLTHYAAEVTYDTSSWLDKNKDPLSSHMTGLLENSRNNFVANLFGAAGRRSSKSMTRIKSGIFRTVAQKHKEQLTTLMNHLNSTQPHFIRCIIPNHSKIPNKFCRDIVLDQLRCNGVLEGIRISRTGFPNRMVYDEFRARYSILAPLPNKNGFVESQKAVQYILDHKKVDKTSYRLGRTKVFFRAGALASLEAEKEKKLGQIMSTFQSRARGFLIRRTIGKLLYRHKAALTIGDAFKSHGQLNSSPWWQLFVAMKPMIDEFDESQIHVVDKTEVENLKKQIDSMTLQSDDYKTKATKHEELYKAAIKELEAERQTYRDKDEIIRRTQERADEMEEELHIALQDIESLDIQCEEIVQSRKAGEKQINELKEQLLQGANIISQLEQRNVDLEAQVKASNHEREFSGLSSGHNKENVQKEASFKSEISLLKRQLVEARNERASELSRLKQELLRKDALFEDAQKALKRFDENALSSVKNQLRIAEEKLNRELQSKENLTRQLSLKKIDAKELIEVRSANERLVSQNRSLKETEADLRSSLTRLQDSLKAAESRIRETDEKHQSEVASIDKKAHEALQKQLSDVARNHESKIADYERKLRDMEHEHNRIVAEVAKSKDKLRESESRASDASSKLQNKTLELQNAVQSNEKLQKKVAEAIALQHSLEKANKDLVQSLSTLQEKQSAHESSARSHNATQQAEIIRLKSEIEKSDTAIKEMKAHAAKLEQKSREQDQLAAKNSQLVKQLQTVESNMLAEQKAAQEKVQSLNAQVKALGGHLKDERDQVARLNKIVAASSESKLGLENSMKRLESEKSALQAQHRAILQTLELESTDHSPETLHRAISRLVSDKQQTEQAHVKLRKRYETLRESLETLLSREV